MPTGSVHAYYARRPWRVGRRNGRILYAQLGEEPSDQDPMIGSMDAPELAMTAVSQHNAWLSSGQRQAVEEWGMPMPSRPDPGITEKRGAPLPTPRGQMHSKPLCHGQVFGCICQEEDRDITPVDPQVLVECDRGEGGCSMWGKAHHHNTTLTHRVEPHPMKPDHDRPVRVDPTRKVREGERLE